MTNIKIIYIAFVVLVFIISGCGQGSGDNPVGVTGGSANGYGSQYESEGDNGSNGGNGSDNELIGKWRHDYDAGEYETFSFSSDGTFYYEYYYNYQLDYSFSGTYSVNGNQLTMEGMPPVTYSISGNTLTISFQGEEIHYYRV